MDSGGIDSIQRPVRIAGEEADTALIKLVYDELRQLAGHMLRNERPGHTLQATALVHEAFLRITQVTDIQWQSPAHFFAFAAQSIRWILVDHARTKGRVKRGGRHTRVELDEAGLIGEGSPSVDVLDLNEALGELASLSARQARIVELRFFGGLTTKDVAEVLGLSVRTVDGEWAMAKAWLAARMGGRDEP